MHAGSTQSARTLCVQTLMRGKVYIRRSASVPEGARRPGTSCPRAPHRVRTLQHNACLHDEQAGMVNRQMK